MKKGETLVGKVKALIPDKEYGFISVNGSDDIYFRYSTVKGDINGIKEGTIVQFKVAMVQGKLRARKVEKTTKPRTIILSKDLPLSVPVYALSLPKSVDTLSKHINENGPILFTWFRDSVNNLIDTGGSITSQNKQMKLLIQEKFPDYQVEILNWPEIYRSKEDTKRSTHPFISRKCRLAVIVSEKDSINNSQSFQSSLVASVYQDVMEKSTDRWTLVGDETGGLEEFAGRNPQRKSEMCWVAIPPSSNPPSLSQNFHVTENPTDFPIALRALKNDSEILLYSFPYEEGNITTGLQGIAADPHLDFWQDTLPLVLENIVGRISEPTTIDIFIEQVGPLESGIGVIAPIVRELKSALNSRSGWELLSFGEDSSVLSKNPCEHPWIGYSDAVGHIRVDKKRWQELTKLVHEIRNRVIYTPYRKNSLNGVVKQLLKNTARSLFFLQSLHSIEANDLKDYIRPFFGNAIKESVDSLEPEEWQELLKHIENNSGDKKGQRATALIHEHLNMNQVLSKLTSPSDKFDLLRMMLGTSNHRGAIHQGLDCKEKADILLKNFDPSPRKLQKYYNICRGLKDNMFDFEEVDRVGDFEYKSNMEEGQLRQLGTRAHSLGLIGTVKARQIALLIERKLAKHGNEDADYSSHRRRHSIYLSELLMDEEKYIEAEEILDEISHKNRDSFFFASHIKCLTLNEKNNVFFKSKDLDFLELLDDDHPSQRIAYWFARWAIQVGEEKEAPAQKCIEHLLSLTEVPLFSHDAPGVILSCELMDLESRGYKINIDTMKFYELVKKNSQPSTIEWLKKHPPNEDDWLAPLNFNYR